MTKTSSLKVSVSGVRGIVGESFTPDLAVDFSASFGRYVGGGKVVVGRDTRTTGNILENAVIAGLLSVGCQPIVLGIVPTPTVQIMVNNIHANGGIAITASHNPAQWNALKFVGSSGIFLDHIEAEELLDVYNQSSSEFVVENKIRRVHLFENAFELHKKKVFSRINHRLIRNMKYKVAVDCCNGAGALYSQKFLEDLGCEVFPLFNEADGCFRRVPEPSAENITKLSEIVKENSCDIGFAQDPDADRITIVDNNGVPIGEQYSVVLATDHILTKAVKKEKEKKKKNKRKKKFSRNVVVNLGTTKAVADVVQKHSGKLFYSKIGEINVIDEMILQKALVGGEGSSGGVIWPAVHPCRDSYAGMALFLEMMALRKQSISEIMSRVPNYFTVNKKIDCSAENSLKIIRSLRKEYAELNPQTLDGIRIDWEDKWLLIRPSNTEPIIRIAAEAKTQADAEKLADEFNEKIISMISVT